MEDGPAKGAPTGNPDRRRIARVVGITGGIGVGKSTVAKAFAHRGAVVIDADRIGHDVLREDRDVHKALVEAFGPGIMGPDGRPVRRVLGEKVFGDAEALATLNRIVHPPLLARLRERIEAAKRDPSVSLVVVEAALIIEWGIRNWFDPLIVVTAPSERVRARLRSKGLTDEQISRRIASQLPEHARIREADVVIRNDGDSKNIEAAVEEILRRTMGDERG